MSRKDRKKVAS